MKSKFKTLVNKIINESTFNAKQIAKKLVDQLEQERIEDEKGGWEIDFDERQMLKMALDDLKEEEGYTDEQIKEIKKECEHLYVWVLKREGF